MMVHLHETGAVEKQVFTPKPPNLAPPKRLREGEGGLAKLLDLNK